MCVYIYIHTLIGLCVNWDCTDGQGSACSCCISPEEAASGWFSGWPLSESLCNQYLSMALEVPVGSAALGCSMGLQLTSWPHAVIKEPFQVFIPSPGAVTSSSSTSTFWSLFLWSSSSSPHLHAAEGCHVSHGEHCLSAVNAWLPVWRRFRKKREGTLLWGPFGFPTASRNV